MKGTNNKNVIYIIFFGKNHQNCKKTSESSRLEIKRTKKQIKNMKYYQ